MDKVIIIGGQGNGTVIAQAITDANKRGYNDLEVAGFFNDRLDVGSEIEGLPVLAKTSGENVKKYSMKGYKFIYTVYRIDGQQERLKLYNELELDGRNLATFVHPSAYVAPDVLIAEGVVVMPNVMISSRAKIGKSTLIMTGATIGHNTTIGENNHIASQAVISSYIKSGTGVHFGLNCTVKDEVKIDNYSTIGMGAVLTKNVGISEIWIGNPAHFVRKAK